MANIQTAWLDRNNHTELTKIGRTTKAKNITSALNDTSTGLKIG
jgi:hypothetical protein